MGDYVIKNLAEPFYNNEYNVTGDNLFSSVSLEDDEKVMAVAYQCKSNKNVILFSTLHNFPAVMINDNYNHTKLRVDVLDASALQHKIYHEKMAFSSIL